MVNSMEELTTSIGSSPLGIQSVEAEFVLTELEIAFSLLDIAAVSERRKIVRGCVRNALSALRTATRFLAGAPADDRENADICQRHDELLKRVREIARQRRNQESRVGPAAPAGFSR
jgi:hypothetical protein